VIQAGVLATAGGVVLERVQTATFSRSIRLTADCCGSFKTGERIKSSPMSYTVNGRQQMAISAGSVLFAFALPE